MAKVRVYELARELGLESKEVLSHLKEMGEFVSSASSTVEVPVVRKLRDRLAGEQTHPEPAPAKKAPAAKAAEAPTPPAKTANKPAEKVADAKPAPVPTAKPGAKKAVPKPQPSPTAITGAPIPAQPVAAKPAPVPAPMTPAMAKNSADKVASKKPVPTPKAPKQETAKHIEPEAPKSQNPEAPVANPTIPAPRPAASTAAATPAAPRPKPGVPKPPAPRPGPGPKPQSRGGSPRPGATGGLPGGGPRPRPSGQPRPGNNPFSSSQGMGVKRSPQGERSGGPRPGPRQGGGQGGAPSGDRPPRPGGMPRPNPAMMPKMANSQLGGRPAGGGGGARPGGRPGGPRAGSRPGGGGPGGPSTGPVGGGRGGRGGRGGAGTQGAFGRSGPGGKRGRKSKKQRRQEFDQMEAPTIGGVRIRKGEGQKIRLRRGASLTDLAEKIGLEAAQLVQVLFGLGEMVTATQSVPDETLEVLGAELNYEIQVVSPEDEDRELLESFDLEFGEDIGDESDLAPRPPVVTVMGHVDHGKTKLLDALRHTNMVAREAGGITQAIGAYQVATVVDDEERKITFIDTPGHEAFTAMRARGAKSTDIAVLVVAADDGVMPQTVEALNHATAAGVPVVVAVNKIDKVGADPTKVRGQLTEYGLVPEEYGGDTMFVNVSATTREGLDKLLESIVLTADAALDLRANPDMPAQGVAIEAHLDKGRGSVATVIVQRGTLRTGDSIVAGSAYGRVRAMIDDRGETIAEAPPSMPVQVLGLTSVPGAGDNLLVVEDDRKARQIADKREARMRAAQQAKTGRRKTLDQLFEQMEKGEASELLLILKGDTAGSVEALEDALSKIDVGDEVDLRVIDRGVGAITLNNINLAKASNAVILGFNVRAEGQNAALADREGVDIRYYSIIYQAIDDIEKALKGMLKPIYEEVQLGTAEIRDIFKSSKVGTIAGCMVKSGNIRRHSKARLVRDGIVIAETEINTLRREKDDVVDVREGYECGITLTNYSDIRVGDVIETHEMVEKART